MTESSSQVLDFKALFEATPGLYLVLTPDLKIVAASDAYLRATMTKREAILHRHVFEVFPDNPNDQEATGTRNLRASLDRMLARRQPDVMAVQKYDVRRPADAGGGFEERHWSPVNSPVFDADGEVVYIIHHVEDVTEFVKLRQSETQKQAEQLQQTTERLASIVEHSDDAIISKDLNGTVVSWNRGAERVFGYTAKEMIGQPILKLIPPDRHNEEPEILARIRAGERVDHYETIRQRKDGSLIDISLTISPIRDATGKVIGASKIARNITQRKQAEATRQLLVNELNHRVKNTLASVQAIAQQTLRSTANPVDFATRFSGRIQSLARVHSLLTEGNWQGADLRELILNQLLQGPVDETKVTAWGPAIRLGPQMALHLALMLHELSTNSAKYGALSSGGGWVTVNWSVNDRVLQLRWVERGGPTVTAPIARGFGTTLIEQSAKSEGGSAQMLCEAEGVTWEIALTLPDGPASMLPAAFEAQLVSPPAQMGKTAAKPAAALAGLRILVVEDEPLIALDLADSLERAGAEVPPPVGTEKVALQMIESDKFDAALLDANLHGHSVGAIAAALTRRKIPFVFVSGYGREGLPSSFRHVTALAKPVSEQQLLEAVEGLLPKHPKVVRLKS